MEFGKSLKQKCACGFEIRLALTSGGNKHENCVFDFKFADLAEKYPEQKDLIAKLWEICHTEPDFWVCAEMEYWEARGVTWDSLRVANLAEKYPEHKDVLIKLLEKSRTDYEAFSEMALWKAKGVNWDAEVKYPPIPKGELHEFAYKKAQLWQLTEGLGDHRDEHSLQRKLTVRDFPWVSRKSILTEDVLAFCDELRYQ
jgi:hypothetical protein